MCITRMHIQSHLPHQLNRNSIILSRFHLHTTTNIHSLSPASFSIRSNPLQSNHSKSIQFNPIQITPNQINSTKQRFPIQLNSNQINSIQIKPNKTKSNRIKSNQAKQINSIQFKSNQIQLNSIHFKSNQIKSNQNKQSKSIQSNSNQIKANQFIPIQIESNQIKSNQITNALDINPSTPFNHVNSQLKSCIQICPPRSRAHSSKVGDERSAQGRRDRARWRYDPAEALVSLFGSSGFVNFIHGQDSTSRIHHPAFELKS